MVVRIRHRGAGWEPYNETGAESCTPLLVLQRLFRIQAHILIVAERCFEALKYKLDISCHERGLVLVVHAANTRGTAGSWYHQRNDLRTQRVRQGV